MLRRGRPERQRGVEMEMAIDERRADELAFGVERLAARRACDGAGADGSTMRPSRAAMSRPLRPSGSVRRCARAGRGSWGAQDRWRKRRREGRSSFSRLREKFEDQFSCRKKRRGRASVSRVRIYATRTSPSIEKPCRPHDARSERPDPARDWADNHESRAVVEVARRNDESRTPSSLLASRARVEIGPDDIPRVGRVVSHRPAHAPRLSPNPRPCEGRPGWCSPTCSPRSTAPAPARRRSARPQPGPRPSALRTPRSPAVSARGSRKPSELPHLEIKTCIARPLFGSHRYTMYIHTSSPASRRCGPTPCENPTGAERGHAMRAVPTARAAQAGARVRARLALQSNLTPPPPSRTNRSWRGPCPPGARPWPPAPCRIDRPWDR